jgi:hypothetical protein
MAVENWPVGWFFCKLLVGVASLALRFEDAFTLALGQVPVQPGFLAGLFV